MVPTKHVLLASHGTPGARAAEDYAYAIHPTTLYHLLVVPDLWRGMLGDDWLSNSATRASFSDYLEAELQREIDQHIDRVSRECLRRAIAYDHFVVLGNPTQCLLAQAGKQSIDLIVIGSPRAKGVAGLRSRVDVQQLYGKLDVPLLIAPTPR